MTAPVSAPRATSTPGYRRLILAHVALGAALFFQPAIATVFAVVVLVQLLRACLMSPRADDVLTAIAYATGVEVLLRMTGARVPWEFSKYLVVFAAVAGLVRFTRHPRMSQPLIYLFLLVPGCVATLMMVPLGTARERLVSNILGPVVLAAVSAFCLSMRATPAAAARVLWGAVLATIPMATFMALTLVTAQNLTFTNEANLAASGNFGPNQVAASLSFALLAIFLLVTTLGERRYRTVLICLGAWLLVASFLTFSRGGLVSFAVAALLVATLLIGDARRLVATVLLVALGAVVVFGLLFPRLDDFTGGQLSRRYQDTSTAHRTSIAEADFGLFGEHPLLGVGAGMSPDLRTSGDAKGRQAHVEFSRLLAEHGMMGLLAMAVLAVMGVSAVRRAGNRGARAWSVGLMAWSLVTMTHSEMRIAAVAVSFGLAGLQIGAARRVGRHVPGEAVPDRAIPALGLTHPPK